MILKNLIEKVHYGFCQRGFSEKLWAAKRTYILIFSGRVYDDSLGKIILEKSIVDGHLSKLTLHAHETGRSKNTVHFLN